MTERPVVPEVVGADNQDVNTIIRAAPSLARFAVAAWWRTTEWSIGAAVNTGNRVFSAVVSGQSPGVVLATLGNELRSNLRQILGIVDMPSMPGASIVNRVIPAEPVVQVVERPLREIGAELLQRSGDMSYDDELHPAYIRILADLAPDEARILRLLATEGSQPSVDVRTSRPLNVATQLVAPGLTMIGAQAGVRHGDRVPAYLNNLFRLGLIWFSREPVADRLRYQVLEAQPDVSAALKEAGRGRTIRRSIELTPFGEDFCKTCLPL
ncbi:MAG TPA: Abi-alpha family protein [Mycobacteriales bacterium]|nr:Abi-alpha family protein [Mycobacteriales bacterium]